MPRLTRDSTSLARCMDFFVSCSSKVAKPRFLVASDSSFSKMDERMRFMHVSRKSLRMVLLSVMVFLEVADRKPLALPKFSFCVCCSSTFAAFFALANSAFMLLIVATRCLCSLESVTRSDASLFETPSNFSSMAMASTNESTAARFSTSPACARPRRNKSLERPGKSMRVDCRFFSNPTPHHSLASAKRSNFKRHSTLFE
mmetsp:Transcript_22920/g.70436  ORF Transcript_22920/g.70436 Transcript_22920/m.70436 type:complete len:201 (-) Transcript_22920:288-890(-)